jgi:3-hydroxybutyryl-CoA dehydrogenase
MKIVLAGPGLMGSQIGCEFAIAGHAVTFVVHRREQAEQRVTAAFKLARTLQLWTDEAVVSGERRVSHVSDIRNADPDADLFIESIVEDAEAKVKALKTAASVMPNALLASNTSSISITRLGNGCGAGSRTLGMHFWNPPLIMPLVEVIRGDQTDPEIVERICGEIRAIGKRPVVVDRDVPGFVWNRLQLALLREAVWIVENGVAAPEVVDQIVREGLTRRWRYTGPFETAALGGPATFTAVAANLWPVLSDAAQLRDLARWLPNDATELQRIKAHRDAGLLRDLCHEREIDRV